MEIFIVVAITLVLLATVILLVLVVGLRSQKGNAGAEGAIADLARKQSEELERVRGAFDAALRETSQQALKSQHEGALQLVEKLEALRKDVTAVLGDRFEVVQRGVGESLTLSRRSQDERLDKVDQSLVAFAEKLNASITELQRNLLQIAKQQSEQQSAATTAQQELLAKRLEAMRDSASQSITALQESVGNQLGTMRTDNERKLEKIRETVEEKLQSTLEKRLGESFRLVSGQLESVQKGLGEMQSLATGVGDLKRVLSNVSSRGALGEVQLATLLEQFLTPAQYRRNVVTIPGSTERVEFAICLPGQNGDGGQVVFLPIDAKFPIADYERLQVAYEQADKAGAEQHRSAIEKRLRQEATTIRRKYVSPPHTTDFAMLFLPTEGLYAEAIRMPGLMDALQRDHRVVLVGPTTLYAVLSSLQMGFRTLAIEKRSSEVWEVLSAVKTEFGKFEDVLNAVKKKLEDASNRIGDTERRSRAISRKLRSVEEMEEHQASALLAGEEPEDGDKG
ncbi:DNA recombination protein RmuC [Candidatus Sumerlaeota bacterium]|nr:DNA recombination protein RmuC [Candidatus Sumerlaeota bacterium]